jgi:cobalt-zinc-cadmium efflux system membrane fusion protein
MRAGKIALAALMLALVLAAAGCGKKQAAAPADAGPTVVSTAKAAMGLLDNRVMVSGKLEAVQTASIVSKVPGKVARVHVDVGDRVSAGQVLVTLENKDLADRVTQAQAAVAQAEAALAQAEAGLKSARSALENARDNFAVAEANYKRARELLAMGAIPQAVFESQYELPYKQAKQALEGTVPAQVEQAQAMVKVQQAALSSARAQLALARSSYEDSFIRAPFTGVVTARNVNPGEMASTMPVISMANIDRVVVKATVGEDYINQLKQGEKVQVKIGAVSAQPFTGVITSIAPAADPTTRAFPIKVEIDNPKHLLKPGMFAEVLLPSSGQKQLLVPREAVVKDGERDYVWVVKQGKVQRREIKAGESDGRYIAVISGLKAGEEVVTAGQESLQDGARVTVKN